MHARNLFTPGTDGPTIVAARAMLIDPMDARREQRRRRRRELIEREVLDLVVAQAERIEELERTLEKRESTINFLSARILRITQGEKEVC